MPSRHSVEDAELGDQHVGVGTLAQLHTPAGALPAGEDLQQSMLPKEGRNTAVARRGIEHELTD